MNSDDRRQYDDDFARQVVACGPDLMQVARRVLVESAWAEDAVAQTFLKAWAMRARLRDPVRLRAWLTRICHNEAVSMLRQRKRRQEKTLPPDDLAQHPARDQCYVTGPDLLAQLPEELKVCAEMFFIEGHSYSQIARLVGLPLSTVRGRIHLSRQRLRKEIQMVREKTSESKSKVEALRPQGKLVRWQDVQVRLLGLAWTGTGRLYDPSGKRLSRVPKVLQHCHLFRDPGPYARDHALSVFWELTGNTSVLVSGTALGVPSGKQFLPHRTPSEDVAGRQVICLMVGGVSDADRRVRLQTTLWGAEDAEGTFRFVPEGHEGPDWILVSGPRLGVLFMTDRRPGPRKGTCTFTVAFSTPIDNRVCRILAIDRNKQLIEPTAISGGRAHAPEGHLQVQTLDVDLSPNDVAGVAVLPRQEAAVDWGSVTLPPRDPAGPSSEQA